MSGIVTRLKLVSNLSGAVVKYSVCKIFWTVECIVRANVSYCVE